MVQIVPLTRIAPAVVESLLDRAFGADRFGRTAYMVRGRASAIASLSFAAVEDDVLVGSVQCWPVVLTAGEIATPLVMVGPVAVDPLRQRDGLGRGLMTAALHAAAIKGLDGALMLIGDPEYYGRFFGFSADLTGAWTLPGLVERRRLLARGPGVPAGAGVLAPAAAIAA